jgi:general stress protein YciG
MSKKSQPVNSELETSAIPSQKRRGFAAMPKDKMRLVAALGGRAAQAAGRAHQFTHEEAKAAGRLGGWVVSQDREHMAEIGRRGREQRIANLAIKDNAPAAEDPAAQLGTARTLPGLMSRRPCDVSFMR